MLVKMEDCTSFLAICYQLALLLDVAIGVLGSCLILLLAQLIGMI